MGIIQSILLDVPTQFETERLLLRAPQAGDGAVVYASVMNSLDDLKVWMPWAHLSQSPEQSEVFQRESSVRFQLRKSFQFHMHSLADSSFLGICELHTVDWSVPAGEIGYWLDTSAQGNGYMTEAVKALTIFVMRYLKMQRIEIRCDSRNKKSAAVAERAGFTLEAHFKKHRRDIQGHLADTLVYARYKS